MMVDRYESWAPAPDGTEGELLAFAQQKGKDFAKSLVRSTWHLSAPGSAPGPLTSSRG